MAQWTKETIIHDAQAHNVTFIRLMFTDILGMIKNVEIPLSQLSKALDGRITFDGSSMEAFVRLEETDMYLHPDYTTWHIQKNYDPNDERIVAYIMCDVYTMDGHPYSGDPRSNLKRILRRMEKMGFTTFNVSPEPEFYLFPLDEKGKPIIKLQDQGGYYDLIANDISEACRRQIVLALEMNGFNIEVSHHEVGQNQHEIDWKYTDVIRACDMLQRFKLIVKTVARAHNLYATFMPKPISGAPGTANHYHLSLFNGEANSFYDPQGKRELSTTAYQFLAGLLKFAPAYTAICNPLVNSYKRLIDGFEAPLYIGWSEKNRSPFTRIPAARGDSTRIEIRSIDATANPYLAMATILQAGLQGIEEGLKPPAELKRNIYVLSSEERKQRGIKDLPRDLDEALDALEASPVMLEALGEVIADSYIASKRIEYESYQRHVSQWEIERYL